jgi:hypothetical protein
MACASSKHRDAAAVSPGLRSGESAAPMVLRARCQRQAYLIQKLDRHLGRFQSAEILLLLLRIDLSLVLVITHLRTVTINAAASAPARGATGSVSLESSGRRARNSGPVVALRARTGLPSPPTASLCEMWPSPSGSLYAPPPRACVSICSPICGLSPILAALCELRSSTGVGGLLLVLCHLPLAFWVTDFAPAGEPKLGQDQTKKRRGEDGTSPIS